MGFFPDIVKEKKAAPKPKSAKKTTIDLENQPRGCSNCPLQATWPSLNSPEMHMSGNLSGDILVLGEFPSEQDDKEGKQFTGRVGEFLARYIPARQVDRLALQNAVQCHTRAAPGPSAIHACSMYVESDIASLPVKAILGLGTVPLSRFWPGVQLPRVNGTRIPVKVGDKLVWYYPVFHPTYSMKLANEKPPKPAANYVLQADIKRFFKEVDTWGEPEIWKPDLNDILYPKTEEEAWEYLSLLKPPYGIDLETQKIKPYLHGAKLLTAAISDATLSIAFPIDHPEAPNDWGARFLLKVAHNRKWIAHNAAFELSWMMHTARQLGMNDWSPAPFEDSMACGRLYHNRHTIISMAMLSRVHLGVDIKTLSKVNINNMVNEPLETILPYNAIDAVACVRLYNALRQHVDTTNYDRFIDTIKSTTIMEAMGLEVDDDYANDLKIEWETKLNDALNKSHSIYEVRQFESTKQKEFSITSNDDIAEALVSFGKIDLPHTSKKVNGRWIDTEKYSTTAEHLREHGTDDEGNLNPLIECILDHREANKQLSTYINATIKHKEECIDGMIHPSYTTMMVATTRLSANDPNIQNYPTRRHRGVKNMVIPDRLNRFGVPTKHVLLMADLGQIDARITACASKDKALIKNFVDKEDIHTYWLNRILKLYPEYLDRLARETNETNEQKVIKAARTIIKGDFVFPALYGSTAGARASATGIPYNIMKDVMAQFWKRYPDVARWLESMRLAYQKTGEISTLCGIIRREVMDGEEIINSPVQGTTAHVVNDSMNALSRMSVDIDDPYLHPRLNIHDDLTFVLPDIEDRIEFYMKAIAEEMVKVRYPWQVCPFTVEMKLGYSWGDSEEITTFTGPYNVI